MNGELEKLHMDYSEVPEIWNAEFILHDNYRTAVRHFRLIGYYEYLCLQYDDWC